MKKLYSILIFVLLSPLFLAGQNTPAIGVSFGTEAYTITNVQECQASATNVIQDDLSFFYEHFNQNDYQKYRSFYYNNSCLASEEDFTNWRAHISSCTIIPVARYLVETGKDTFSIISYTMGSTAEQHYAPLALEKKNNRWYLMDLKSSEETMPMKMFLAYVNPTFIQSFLERPDEMKAKYMASIFTAKGNLNGDLLMNYYEARYDPSAEKYSLSREVFHNAAILAQDQKDLITSEVKNLADEYHIPAAKKMLLDNMTVEGNYNMALSKIAEWSGTSDVKEITDKFHAGLNAAVKKN